MVARPVQGDQTTLGDPAKSKPNLNEKSKMAAFPQCGLYFVRKYSGPVSSSFFFFFFPQSSHTKENNGLQCVL